MEVIFASIFFGMLIATMLILFFVLGRTENPETPKMDDETAKIILQNLKLSASRGERNAIDYVIEILNERIDEYDDGK